MIFDFTIAAIVLWLGYRCTQNRVEIAELQDELDKEKERVHNLRVQQRVDKDNAHEVNVIQAKQIGKLFDEAEELKSRVIKLEKTPKPKKPSGTKRKTTTKAK